MSTRPLNSFRHSVLPAALLAGDTIATFAGLAGGYLLRYHSPIGRLGIDVTSPRVADYLPLLAVGAGLLLATFAHLGLYDERILLRRYQAARIVLRGTTFWLAAYLGLSLALRFDPPISRLFVGLTWVTTLAAVLGWRAALQSTLRRPGVRERLQRRVAILGWTPQAATLARSLDPSEPHPWRIIGVIPANPDDAERARAAGIEVLGPPDDLATAIRDSAIDVLVSARADPTQDRDLRVPEVCEAMYVEWKVIPSAFQLFTSGLRLQTIGSVPLLGVEDLALRRPLNRALKRLLDVVGGAAGLLVSAPLIALLAVRIRWESPGPAFFRQERIGRQHRPFTLWKLRSMAPGSEAEDHLHQSTRPNDPRLTRTGAFIRRWNLDELPQFWNVLRGDMSLVGPRPERPIHVARLARTIPHYLPRHLVKPGLTGWAQVNGLRGDTSLELRIQHDIWYIENWSIWLDIQILALTLLRWREPQAR